MFKEIHFSTLPSTHRYALEQLRPYTLITAREQTEGIGRKGTAWHAKGDNFLGSFVLPTPERDLENLGQLLCHSAMHALEEFAMVPLFKWPNDILLSYKKVGGVMADVRGDVSVVSLGLNVNMTKAELDSIDTPATSLSEELHAEISLHDVKQSVIKHFTKDLRVFEKEGFAPFFAPFSAKLAFLGKLARAGRTKGVIQGLTPDGRLLLDQTPVSTNVLEVL